MVATDGRRADRGRRSHRSAWRSWHQRRAAGVVPVGREVGDDGVLGLFGLLRAVRGDHLFRVRAQAEQGARRRARDGRRGQLGGRGRGLMSTQKSVVVVGHGMVGHRFVEARRDRDRHDRWHITVLCEEPTPAYDRVALSSYVDSWDRSALALPGNDYAGDDLVHLRVGERAATIDRDARTVTTSTGARVGYHALVLATGSYPFVPPIPGKESDRCFVYRTLDDLDAIRVVAEAAEAGAPGIVVGGGLLGLEAANALRLIGLTPHVVELPPRLVPSQGDQGGGAVLADIVTRLGLTVHTGVSTTAISDDGNGLRATLSDGETVDGAVLVFSAGVRPRDELARACGLETADRGGVVTDIACRTTDPHIYAIGEVAAIEGRCYGLVAPCYATAEGVT